MGKHFVIKTDDQFNEAMSAIRYITRAKSDGDVLYHSVMKTFENFKELKLFDSLKKVKNVDKINNISIVDKIKNLNFIKTDSVYDGYVPSSDVKKMTQSDVPDKEIARVMVSLGFSKTRKGNKRVWLVRQA